jgi:hypothetical protein
MKIKNLTLIAFIILTISSCKKNSDNALNTLTTKTWKRALNDKNPSTNLQGTTLYYAVQNCEKDDTFKFGSDGNLILNRGTDKCESNETQNYTLDRTKKELIINGNKFTLAEESSDQIKYYAAIPQASGFSYLIYLLR